MISSRGLAGRISSMPRPAVPRRWRNSWRGFRSDRTGGPPLPHGAPIGLTDTQFFARRQLQRGLAVDLALQAPDAIQRDQGAAMDSGETGLVQPGRESLQRLPQQVGSR